MRKIFLLMTAGMLLLAGCDNLLKPLEKADEAQTAATTGEGANTPAVPNDGRAYLCVTAETGSGAARTALPTFTAATVADFAFTLKGTISAGTEKTLGTYENLSALQTASIPVDSGTWNFTLTAEKDGTAFTGSLADQVIEAGANVLSFTLTWDESALGGTGSLTFTLDFSAAENAGDVQAVTGELVGYNAASGNETTAARAESSTSITLNANKATYTLSDVAGGTYRVKIRLYADAEKTTLINTWRELAVITGGQTSTATREMDSLNKVYAITYHLDGGTLRAGEVKQETYTRNSAEIPLPVVEKAGYTFGGWYENADLSGSAVTSIPAHTTGNKEFWAKWEEQEFTVTFVNTSAHASAVSGATATQTYKSSDTKPLTAAATMFTAAAGYEFAGWALSDGGTKVHDDGEAASFTADTTLYARWSATRYAITYHLDGGTNDAASPATYTVEDAVALGKPTKTGWAFGGWYAASDLSGAKVENISAGTTGNKEYWAQWSAATVSVSVAAAGDLALTSETSGTQVTLTVTGASGACAWYVDGTLQTETGATLTLETSPLGEGTYEIEVTNGTRGASITVTVSGIPPAPAGFAFVAGSTVSGAVGDSKVFITGRTVEIADLYVSDHEVTQGEWEQYMTYYGVAVGGTGTGASGATTPYAPSNAKGKGENFPAYYVNWYEAVIYCNLKSLADRLTPAYTYNDSTDLADWISDDTKVAKDADGKYYFNSTATNAALNSGISLDMSANGYRLPTEAEWEYIAREANESATTYSGSDTVDDVAWYTTNSSSKAHEVKTKAANGLGIYDMSGNVWEWCWDWNSTVSATTPAVGASSGSNRVYRGGSWSVVASNMTVSHRNNYNPCNRSYGIGFRVVRNAN